LAFSLACSINKKTADKLAIKKLDTKSAKSLSYQLSSIIYLPIVVLKISEINTGFNMPIFEDGFMLIKPMAKIKL